ncbi:MAG: hypothetical protein AABX63_00335, partial [Nanoarchaeota archaeon]
MKKNIFSILILSFLLFLSTLYPAWAENISQDNQKKYENLILKAQSRGGVRIIVGVDVHFIPEGFLTSSQAQNQRDLIVQQQNALLNFLAAHNVTHIKRFKYSPYIAVEINEAGLTALVNNPNVVSIEEDVLSPPLLMNSIPLIGADVAWNAGYTGAGWTVAI